MRKEGSDPIVAAETPTDGIGVLQEDIFGSQRDDLWGADYGALQSSPPVEGRLALKKAVPRRSAKNLGNEPLVPG
jgi:hypothetical protein